MPGAAPGGCWRARGPARRAGSFPSNVRGVPVLVALALLLLPGTAFGTWNGPEEVTLGSAHTLEQGAFEMGVFSPLQYGAHDRVTLATHPVLHLLLTPNLALRVRALDGPIVLSVQLGYQQTFLGERDGGFPGTVHAELLLSARLGSVVGVTAIGGYAWAFNPADHRLHFGGTLHFLVSRADLIMVQVLATHSFFDTLATDWPAIQILYAHAWHTFHLGVGVAVGRYEFVPWEDVSLDVNGVPIYPVIDVWWRF